MIPTELINYSFDRFRTALNDRLDKSQWLVRMDERYGEVCPDGGDLNLANSSIICFSVKVLHSESGEHLLDQEECRKIFHLLNLDLSGELGELSLADRARARLQAHIGQPVFLESKDGREGLAILRMVLGARFFSIVAFAGPGSVEAALESEISDAIWALEKLELLAQKWCKTRHIVV
jgi:hypothetical protein